MTFTEELKRRRKMTLEMLDTEQKDVYLKYSQNLVQRVEKIFSLHFKERLSANAIKYHAAQTVGEFQEYMELGGFCRHLDSETMGDNTVLHSVRVEKRDIQGLSNNLKKSLKAIIELFKDPGACQEFQRRLWELASSEDARQTRRDLWVLQALSGLEMIAKTTEAMQSERILFKRGNEIIKKTRRVIISRLAYLFESAMVPGKNHDTLLALKYLKTTITKSRDYGDGKKTLGNDFINFVREVLGALGLADDSELKPSGTTIRNDIITAIEEFEDISI